jgi:hypothetical protein
MRAIVAVGPEAERMVLLALAEGVLGVSPLPTK